MMRSMRLKVDCRAESVVLAGPECDSTVVKSEIYHQLSFCCGASGFRAFTLSVIGEKSGSTGSNGRSQ